MLSQITGIHHITSISSDAVRTDSFLTSTLGLKRVKKTVNFDAPDVYHLYYGNATGSPGSVMTYFPFPDAKKGTRGAGEVGITRFAIPPGTSPAWRDRLNGHGVFDLRQVTCFGAPAIAFSAPDGDFFALVETDDDRAPFAGTVSAELAIRGFHSAQLCLDSGASDDAHDLLAFMGYKTSETDGDVTRLILPDVSGAATIDIQRTSQAPAQQGAGSVHHIAFAVKDRADQLAVRQALLDAGHQVTPVIDRDYFWAIYFRIPGGILFEIATGEPGFDTDEDPTDLGRSLKLPQRHEHLRDALERALPSLD